MKDKIKEITDKYFGQIMNTKVLIIIFIIGIAMLFFPGSKKETNSEIKSPKSTYKQEMENDLKEIIQKIKGVGKVSVMVTLSDSGDTVYATDEKTDTQENSKTYEKNHVLTDEGNNKEALVIKQYEPKISGVLVCAEGAGNIEVRKNIISAVTALLGIKSHRIEVLERG